MSKIKRPGRGGRPVMPKRGESGASVSALLRREVLARREGEGLAHSKACPALREIQGRRGLELIRPPGAANGAGARREKNFLRSVTLVTY